ncbi:MAG: glycosyltransferase [Candidatus Omnitrophica bacterium]|nr:glycosyltransferase [Candidatus Omnitrophota bacterium]
MVSIIIPTHNSSNSIIALLLCIQKTALKEYEVVIVDDASTDSTVEVCKTIGVHQIIQFEQQQGPARARNVGASNAQGEILIFIDSDVTWSKDSDLILKIYEIFQNNTEIDCIATISDVHPTIGNSIAYNNSIYHQYYIHKLFNGKNSVCQRMMFFSSRLGGIRKNKFKDSGGFHESLKTVMGEDGEFWNRCYYLNYKVYLDRTLVHSHAYPTRFWRFIKSYFLATMVHYFISKKMDTTPDVTISNVEKLRRLYVCSMLLWPALFFFMPFIYFLIFLLIGITMFILLFGTINNLIWKYVPKRYVIQWYLVYIAITPFIVGGYVYGIYLYARGVPLLKGKPSTLSFFTKSS